MRHRALLITLVSGFVSLASLAQDKYQYHIDLTKVTDDKLQVELTTPRITKSEVNFYFPKIVPGTYRNANYGRFVTDLKAFDQAGKALPVTRVDSNTWKIRSANKLARISYAANDTWDDKGKGRNDIYTMAGTNIEANKNFVINSPGFFGYFEGMRENDFQLRFTKPENFYAATALVPTSTNSTSDVFNVTNIDELYDSPIMFSLPDTASVKIGDATVLVAVYSPKKLMKAPVIMQGIATLLKNTTKYLGGKLPVKKYAFIYYFNGEQDPSINQGALEHNYSSFYTIGEVPPNQIMPLLVDISSHEFFHIVSPLLLSSKEIKIFNFQEPVMSRHLWLYEGSTEYASDHVQVKYGMITPQEFLNKLTTKINNSKRYNDTLAFTRLSLGSTGQYGDQFNNVYEKGALIAACLDLKLLSLSSGTYGITQLKNDLTWKFGKDKYFTDADLFDVIASVTYPEIRQFFAQYVEQGNPIPYADFFQLAGVKVIPEKNNPVISYGGIIPENSADGKVLVSKNSNFNDFGKKMAFQHGDQLLSIQGQKVTTVNVQDVINDTKAKMKEGDVLKIEVGRKNASGAVETVLLSAPIEIKNQKIFNVLEFMEGANEEQVKIRNAWLTTSDRPLSATANPADVKDINSIITTLYNVISGKAGPRNWERFRSIYYPGAKMSAVNIGPNGTSTYREFTFEEYIAMNSPLFSKQDFYEQELGRKVQQYGNLAQVQTAYQFKLSENGQVAERGINHVTLVYSQGRWWITQISWQPETPGNPIPADLLKQ